MKVTMDKAMGFGFLLLFMCSCRCLAQSGYNYVRPDVIASSAASTNTLRPIVPIGNTGSGTATAATASTYPNAPTGYSGPATAAAATGSPFGAYNPATAATAFSGNTPASFAQRPILQSRTGASGIYAGSPQQFANTVRGSVAAGAAGSNNAIDNDYDGDYSAIPGVPAVDYPVYAQVPRTNFDCAQQLPGYYADVEAQCQVFHICALNRTYSFLCPNGTIFSQETLVCVWWNQFDCASAPSLYANNAFIYDYSKEGIEGGRATQSIGIGTSSRTATNYVGAGNVGVSRSTASALPTGSVYNPNNLRANAFAGVPTAVSGLTATNFGQGENLVVGRFMSASTQTYNVPATAVTPAPYVTSVLRGNSGSNLTGAGGGAGGTFPSAQISTTSTNREYLPPRRP